MVLLVKALNIAGYSMGLMSMVTPTFTKYSLQQLGQFHLVFDEEVTMVVR
jgi:hypothetical protein